MEQYRMLYSYIKTLESPKRNCLIVKGPPGTGKTYQITKQLEKLKEEDGIEFACFNSHMAPMTMYTKFYNHRDEYIFLDDVSGIINNSSALSVLQRATMDEKKRKLQWNSSTGKLNVPRSFEFTGKIIMSVNEFDTSNDIKQSILDRSIFYEMEFTYEERLELIYEVSKKPYRDTSDDQRYFVAEWIRKHSNPASDITLRTFFTIMDYFIDCPDMWEYMAFREIEFDPTLEKIYRICTLNDTIGDARRQFKEEMDKSGRQFYRYLRRLRKRTEEDLI